MFTSIFTCHSQDVFTYFVRRVGPDEADDLTAETFLQAWRARGSYDASRGTCGQWVHGIAHNMLRRRWRDGERADRAMLRLRMAACADRLGEDEEQVVERIIATELAPGLRAGLDKLSEVQRKVVLDHVLRDVSFEELAEDLGRDAGSVRSSLHRARRHLANALATWEGPS